MNVVSILSCFPTKPRYFSLQPLAPTGNVFSTSSMYPRKQLKDRSENLHEAWGKSGTYTQVAATCGSRPLDRLQDWMSQVPHFATRLASSLLTFLYLRQTFTLHGWSLLTSQASPCFTLPSWCLHPPQRSVGQIVHNHWQSFPVLLKRCLQGFLQ